MAYLSLDPVTVRLGALLNVTALTTLITGSTIVVSASPPQGTAMPYVWVEVHERELGRLGGGGLAEVDVRVHAFSDAGGPYEAHRIIQKVIELLRDQPLGITGYNSAAVFYDETKLLNDQVINGVKVCELVAFFRVYVKETA